MVTKKAALTLLITVLFLFALMHTLFQFLVYGGNNSISGFLVGKVGLGEEIDSSVSPLSIAFLIIEWTMLIVIVGILILRGRMESKDEMATIVMKDKFKKEGNTTDLDVLYTILKKKKHLKIGTVAKIFGIKKEIAKEWCETLESGDLATLHYPTIGDPEIVLNR